MDFDASTPTDTHDANGNLTSDGVFQYQYDNANQLTNVVRLADNARVLSARYDALGRRVEATRADGSVERYVYFPGSFLVLAVLDGTNAVKEVYTRGPVDVVMYGSHVPFNEQGLDTTGWLSQTTNLWASSTRHLERKKLGRDTDAEEDWHDAEDEEEPANSESVLDTDGDGLADEQEYTGGTNPLSPDMDGDGLGDGLELALGFDPLDAESRPRVTVHAVLNDTNGAAWVELYSADAAPFALDGFRLETGNGGVWSTVATFASGTCIQPGCCLLIGESGVTNRDVAVAGLGLPSTWPTKPTAGVRLAWSGATNGNILDAVLVGGGSFAGTGNLSAEGWRSSGGVAKTNGFFLLERLFAGVDTDYRRDWTWRAVRPGRDSSVFVDSDGDGLSDGEELSGSCNPFGEPTDPFLADSDGDGLTDSEECDSHGTNPNAWSTAGAIWPWMPEGTVASNWPGSDSYFVFHEMDPTNVAMTTNGFPAFWEELLGGAGSLTSGVDTDGDGVDNADEVRQNSNPQDPDDSEPKPYVVSFEATSPGWVNGGWANDIGLHGKVWVRFLGAKAGERVCVRVSDGNVPEEFTLKWQDAEEIATAQGETPQTWYTSASLSGNSVLEIEDAGKHADYTNSLGGEYTISHFTVDLSIWNGGSDLDNGQNTGDNGAAVPDEDEESVGAYLLVNWDDDDADGSMNANGTWTQQPEPDLAENWVENEDNLARLQLTIDPVPESGIAELEISGIDADKVKLWTQREKGMQIHLNAGKIAWDLSDSAKHTEFSEIMQNGCWLEGVDAGTIERGIALDFRYKSGNGTILCDDRCLATVVMIHLGNAVYRENLVGIWGNYPLRERCHTGIVYSFDGAVTVTDLSSPERYGIVQMQGLDPSTEKLSDLTGNADAEYWYCYTHTGAVSDNLAGYRNRLKVLRIAYWAIHEWNSNYASFDCLNPYGPDWDGTLTDVKELRCDGLVELAYEINDIMVWGKIVDGGFPRYDMRNGTYLDEHNDWQWGDDPEDWDWDMYGTCLPVTQGGFADNYVEEHRPDYSGAAFRGNLWDTTFQEQRLTMPEILSPERHEHGQSN